MIIMGEYKVIHLGHNISQKKDKDPVIKIDFTPDEDDYQDIVADLTALKSLRIVIESRIDDDDEEEEEEDE